MAEHQQQHSLLPYALVLGALLVLTALTVGVAYVDFGHPWSDLVALLIALSKATLVVLFFMHVKGSTSVIKITAAGSALWLVILFAFLMADVLTRHTLVPGWGS